MPSFRPLLFLNGVVKYLEREEVKESAEDGYYKKAYKIVANVTSLSQADRLP